jgi:hypothetical protein
MSVQTLVTALRNLTATARTFRNVPAGEQEWTAMDDEALDAAFAALAAHDAAVTAGGWTVEMTGTISAPPAKRRTYREPVCYPASSGDAARMQRIVDCVNALQGIADPAGLVDAARDVIASWDSGDLAGAVRDLAEAIGDE